MSLLTYKNKDNIAINKQDLTMYGLVFIDNDLEIEGQFGSSFSINTNNNILINKTGEGFTFSLRFAKKVNGIYDAMDDIPFLKHVLELFTQQEVVELQIGMKFIYCTTIGGRMIRQTKNNTIIEIDFQSLSPYVYSQIYTKENLVEANTPFQLTFSNEGKDTSVLLEIQAMADGNFSLTKDTNTLAINTMKNGDIVTIDGDSKDISNSGAGTMTGSIVDTLILKNGVNNYTINCTAQFKVVLKWQEEFEVY